MAVADLTKGAKASSETAARKEVELFGAAIRDVQAPTMPTKALLAEGRRIFGRVKKDTPALLKWSVFTRADALVLGAAIELFEAAASAVFAASAPVIAAHVRKSRDKAEALLTSAWNDLQYVADELEDADLSRKVGKLREGDSLDDTVEDVALTAPLVRTYVKELKKHGSPDGASWVKELATLQKVLEAAQSDSELQDGYDEKKERRDRLGMVLESHLARVCRHGRKAFASDPPKAKQYINEYRAETRSRTASTPDAPPN